MFSAIGREKSNTNVPYASQLIVFPTCNKGWERFLLRPAKTGETGNVTGIMARGKELRGILLKLKDNSHLYGDAKATAKSVAAGARVKEIEEASIAFEAENDNPAAIKRLAIALTAASRIDEAEKLYSKYVSVAPADQDAFYEYALLNKLLGNKIKAI